MDKITIYTKENAYYLESATYIFDHIHVKNEKSGKTLNFEQINKLTWKISTTTLSDLFENNSPNKGVIYYGLDDKQISGENFEIITTTALQLRIDNQDLVLYHTLGHYLRFMWNKQPSLKSYYKSGYLTEVSDVSHDSLEFTIKIKSQYLALSSLTLIIKNRVYNLTTELPSNLISVENLSTNNYESTFIVKLSPSEIFPLLTEDLTLNAYDLSIFDYSFKTTIANMTIKELIFRLPMQSKKAALDFWYPYDQSTMVLLSFYSTKNGNLSNKLSLLKKEVYSELKTKDDTFFHPVTTEKILLITEYPQKAQDNGLAFFDYLMKNKTEFKPYYVVTNDSKDLKNLKKYRDNVIFYKSIAHIELFFKAKYLAHTHNSNYVLPFYSDSTITKLKKINKVFLQHGITGSKDVSKLYGNQYHPTFTDKFIVSSQREATIIQNKFNYSENDIKITGLARFDNLLNKNWRQSFLPHRKRILIMPTWRNNQEFLSDSDFLETTFYKTYQSLITNSDLKLFVKSHKIDVNFYLHTNFQKYRHLFNSEFVSILPEGQKSVQFLLKNHELLITDYSSVGLDFALQNRPILYYRFPEELTKEPNQTNSEFFLPGPIVSKETDLINQIKVKIFNHSLDVTYQQLIHENLYSFTDCNARLRILKVFREFE
ncbi:CDP-glycerol glycerophosphotransferase family protein [Dellaglioa sp. L3N]